MSIDWDFLLTTAAWLAARTETKIDDMLVELVRAAKDDPFIGKWLTKQIEVGNTTEISEGGTLSFVHTDQPAAITQALFDGKVFKNAKSIGDVAATLKELAPYLVQLATLVKLFTGK